MSRFPLFFLADDDTDDQDFFLDALREINVNINCVFAGDGLEALEKLKQEQVMIPDFIFLDQNMPRMNGLECLRELKKIDALKPVTIIIYSTSTPIIRDKEEADKLGSFNFYKKTPSFRQLVNYLQTLIETCDEWKNLKEQDNEKLPGKRHGQ